MARTSTKFAVPVVVLAAAVGGGYYLTRPKPVAVVVHALGHGTVESTVANTRAGTVEAHRRASLAPSLGGQVIELGAHEGDAVTSGQVLLRLWAAELEAQRELARAQALQSDALAEEACHRASLAEREAERLRVLEADGIAAEEEVDRARSTAEALRAACRAAEAGRKVRLASVAAIEARLDETVLKAPFDGIVAEVNCELGEFVTPSPVGIPTLPAIDLIDRTSMHVSAPLDEVDAPHVAVGMAARITLDAFGSRAFVGEVQRIAPYVLDIEKQARTVEVEVRFANPGETAELLPGYSADIEVVLATHDGVLRIPTESVLEGNRVLVFDQASGTLVERTFEKGLSSWRYTEVVGGLEAGELVVLSLDRVGVKADAEATIERVEDRR